LVGRNGEFAGKLRVGGTQLIVQAEQLAERENLAKSSALSRVLREQIDASGFVVGREAITDARALLDKLRRGEKIDRLDVTIEGRSDRSTEFQKESDGSSKMSTLNAASGALQFFEREQVFPDDVAKELYDRLMGLDDHKKRVLVELELLLFPERLSAWSKKHHGRILRVCEVIEKRSPLILFDGDVGCGKTALAETVGDALARRIGKDAKVHLLKMNTQVRGSGLVGEMSDLIVQAFAQAELRAEQLRGPLLLLIDEADALAAKREEQHMHHEDKAGLNTLLQRVDNLRWTKVQMVVIFVTNRFLALDSAVRRRVALRLSFARPDEDARKKIFGVLLPELHLNAGQLKELARLTGKVVEKNRTFSFTASDITDRLLPAAVRDSYSDGKKLLYEDIVALAESMEPTEPI